MLGVLLLPIPHAVSGQRSGCAVPERAAPRSVRGPALEAAIFNINSRLFRFWRNDGSQVAIVQFALIKRDEPYLDADVHTRGPLTTQMTFRQTGAGEQVHDTAWRQGFNRSSGEDGNIFANGYVAVPLVPGLTSWSLTETSNQWTRISGGACAVQQPLPSGSIVVSDLALAGEKIPDIWDAGEEPVRFSRSSIFERKHPIHLTYQVKSDSNRSEIRTSITLTDIGDHGLGKQISQLAFTGRLASGITLVERDIGLSKLKSGIYQLELQVSSLRGGGRSVRMTTFTVK
jgi:hypothetical protein